MKNHRPIKTAPQTMQFAAVGVTALYMMFAPPAQACGGNSTRAGVVTKLSTFDPMLALNTMQPSPRTDRTTPDGQADGPSPNIVGLWEVTFHVGGTLYDHALQQFYADGNETENSALYPPEGGNICFGIWKQQDAKTFSLKHYGWLFDKGNFTGTLILTATNRVGSPGRDSTYSGTFVVDVILPSGQIDPTQHAAGTVEAVRLN